MSLPLHWAIALWIFSLLAAGYCNTFGTDLARRSILARQAEIDAALHGSAPGSSSAGAGSLLVPSTCSAVLYDVGLEMPPELFELYWLPDTLVLLLLGLSVAAVHIYERDDAESDPSSPVISNRRDVAPSVASPRLARLALLCSMHAYILLLRCATSTVTVYSGSPRCIAQSLLHAENAGLALNTGCFDLMFSGHASFSALIGSVLVWHREVPLWMRALVSVLAVVSCASNIFVGDHYASDVLVGSYVGFSMAWMHKEEWRRTRKGVYVK
jgi:hypothetical protein